MTRLLGHPVHPMTVHLPIGLLLASTGLTIVGAVVNLPPVAEDVARWTLGLGICGGLVAASVGLVDLVAIPPEHPATRRLYAHLTAMAAALSTYAVAFLAGTGLPIWAGVLLSALGAALLSGGAWAGGDLVYSYGVGVRSTEGDQACHKTRSPPRGETS